jgi:hypothetical protein
MIFKIYLYPQNPWFLFDFYYLLSLIGNIKLQRKVQILLYHLLLLGLNLLFLLFNLFLLLFLKSSSFSIFSLYYFSPIPINISWYPGLYLYSRNSLHSEYFQCDIVTSRIRVWHPLNILVMTTLGMLGHWVNRWEFFGASWTTKMFGFLMMMKNNLIFEWLFTIKAKRL